MKFFSARLLTVDQIQRCVDVCKLYRSIYCILCFVATPVLINEVRSLMKGDHVFVYAALNEDVLPLSLMLVLKYVSNVATVKQVYIFFTN